MDRDLGDRMPWLQPKNRESGHVEASRPSARTLKSFSSVSGDMKNILASFRSEDGYAEPSKFEAIITPPRGMSTRGRVRARYSDMRSISLRVESISLPGRNLNTLTDSNIYGPTREVVNGVTYAEDISITFQASVDLRERKFFEEWQNLAINTTTWDIGYYDSYTGEIDIYIIDRENARRYGLKLHEAFPKTISATALNGASSNEIIKNEISFAFRYWTPLEKEIQTAAMQQLLSTTLRVGNYPATVKYLEYIGPDGMWHPGAYDSRYPEDSRPLVRSKLGSIR
ncbi:hypothetical protein CMI47_16080 [Candidatus Pacearchaeota archaeon]|nr:hypothetical protein [Candidatus Pacearchaeota archaeon]